MIPITERTAIEIALKKFNASMIRDFIRKEKIQNFISLLFGLIYIFFSENVCLTIINYYLFVGIKKSNLLSTIYLIKKLLINSLNPKVLKSIKSYDSWLTPTEIDTGILYSGLANSLIALI